MADGAGLRSNKPKSPQVLNKELGDFVLLERIGQGGMGTVFKAVQKSLDRLVAVKVLSPHVAKDRDFIERFKREAKAAAALNHPNIVRAIMVGEAQGLHYFVMELLDGETARQRLDREGPLPLADVLEIARQTALALAHAHRKGILHRDIKPENLMLSEGPEGLMVKVMDMGLARLLRQDSSLTQEGTALGTPLYNAPEQARGAKELTPACDLYALGATLFHLATGKPPFEGESAVVIMTQHVTEPPPNPQDINPELPDEFCTFLLQLLAKDPEERYESAEVLAADLQAAIDGTALERAPSDGGDTARVRQLTAGRGAHALRRRAFSKRGKAARSSSLVPLGIVTVLLAAGGAAAYYYLYLPAKAKAAADAAAEKAAAEPRIAAVDPEQKRVEELLAAARQVEKERPDDLDAQRKAWLELRQASGAWRCAGLVDGKLDELTMKSAAAAATAISEVLAKAKEQANKGDCDAALAVLDSFPQQYQQGTGKEAIQTATARIRGWAQAEGEKLLKRAADLEAAGNQEAALEAYTAAARFKYEPVAGKAAQKAETLKGTLNADKVQALEATQATGEQVVALIRRVRDAAAARKFDVARDETAQALAEPAYAPKIEVLKSLEAGLKAFPELGPLIEKRLAQDGGKGITIPGSRAVYLKLEDGRLQFKPAPDLPAVSNKPLETVKVAELVALSGIGEVENLRSLPAGKLGAFGALLALTGQTTAARRVLERGVAERQAGLAQWNDVLVALEGDEKELLAAAAWDEAEELFVKKQYRAAQLAYLAFRAEYRGTKLLAEKDEKISLRLEAIGAVSKTQPGAETKTSPAAPPPKETWQNTDIGSVSSKGSFSAAAAAFTIKVGGGDIYYKADGLHFAYQTLTGDGEIVARAVTFAARHEWAKAGVMMRESLRPESRNVAMLLTVSHGSAFQQRPETGGETTFPKGAAAEAPVWLKLTRVRDTFTAFRSADGAKWTKDSFARIGMGQTIYVGLAISSGAADTPAAATFDNVSVVGVTGKPATPPSPPSSQPPPPPPTPPERGPPPPRRTMSL
ncbi:MAG: protein kinase [Planctomycetota bacterium]|nr:protein kinase [Planctomycetota bacterium]